MKSVNNLTLILTSFALLVGLWRPSLAQQPLPDLLLPLGLTMSGLDGYAITKDFVRQTPDGEVQILIAERSGQIVRFEITKNVNQEFAANYAEAKRFTITSQFKTLDSPYPGMITNKIDCPKEFHPEQLELTIAGQATYALILFSTARMTYGACTEDLTHYKGAFTVFYDAQAKNLYQYELFVPKAKFVKQETLDQLASIKFTAAPQTQVSDPGSAPAKPAAQNLNLIIIGFDPLGATHLPMNGYHRMTMPKLAALAKTGYYFTQAISPSCWTLPTFMTWFTSVYPTEHKITNRYRVFTDDEKVEANLKDMSPNLVTLAEVLKNQGFSTAAFTGDAGVNSVFGYGQGFDTYYDDTPFAGFDVVLPKAQDWLKENKDRRFFLFLQAYDVHGRHGFSENHKPEFIDPKYKGTYQGTPDEYWALRDQSLEAELPAMAPADLTFWRDWYDSKIFDSDRLLADFFQKIKELGILDNTVVIISSASGNEFYEHKRFDHGYGLYDELIRVPFLILIPGHTGRTIDAQVRTLDILPTVLQLLKINSDEMLNQIRGTSLIPLIKGENLELVAYSETDYLFQFFKRSIRTPDGWKFILSLDTGTRELFNLKSDPGEQTNLIETEPQKAKELELQLLEWMRSTGQDQFYHKELLRRVFRLS